MIWQEEEYTWCPSQHVGDGKGASVINGAEEGRGTACLRGLSLLIAAQQAPQNHGVEEPLCYRLSQLLGLNPLGSASAPWEL